MDPIEDTLHQLQTDVAVIKSNYATRDDVHKVSTELRAEMGELGTSLRTELHRSIDDLRKAINDQTWRVVTWMTSIGIGLVASTFWIARTVH